MAEFLTPYDRWPKFVTGSAAESASSTAQTLTLTGASGQRWRIYSYIVTTRGTKNAIDIAVTIKDGSTVIWHDTVNGQHRVQHSFVNSLAGTAGNNMTVEIGDPGDGATTTVAVEAFLA